MASARTGLLKRVAVYLLGNRTRELEEEVHRASPLVYVLTLVQSAAVVLVLGHTELLQLFSSGTNFAVKVAVAALLGTVVLTVVAADLTVVRCMNRIGALKRTRSPLLFEHYAYIAFLFGIEITTLTLLFTAMDRSPASLISTTGASIIPTSGVFFGIQTVARAVLLGWTSIQLNIVNQPLPRGPDTLDRKMMGMLGGQAVAQLDLYQFGDADLADIVNAYAKVAQLPPRQAHWWNRGAVERENTQRDEQIHHTTEVVAALKNLAHNREEESELLRLQIVEMEEKQHALQHSIQQEIRNGVVYALLYYAQHREFPAALLASAPELADLALPGSVRGAKLPRSVLSREPKGKTDAQRFLFESNGITPFDPPTGRKGTWMNRAMVEWATEGKYTGESVTNFLKMLGGKATIGRSYVAPFDAVMRDLYQRNLLGDVCRIWWESSGYGLQIIQSEDGEIHDEISASASS
jgi:hypothetical protein